MVFFLSAQWAAFHLQILIWIIEKAVTSIAMIPVTIKIDLSSFNGDHPAFNKSFCNFF